MWGEKGKVQRGLGRRDHGRVEGIVGWVDGIVGRIERMSEKERDCRPIYLDADAERERQGEDEE